MTSSEFGTASGLARILTRSCRMELAGVQLGNLNRSKKMVAAVEGAQFLTTVEWIGSLQARLPRLP
jgi:hypothetical protein